MRSYPMSFDRLFPLGHPRSWPVTPPLAPRKRQGVIIGLVMGLLSAVATRCTPARWCIQRIHRRRSPSCTSSCSRITDNLMSSSSGLRLLSLLSSFLPWPGARSRPRASSYLQWQRELHDLQWQRELFAVHSQVIHPRRRYLDHACWRCHPRRCVVGLTRTLVVAAYLVQKA